MHYIANYKTFEASDGTQQRVLMSFQVPPAGKEADNLSLLVSTQSYPDVMSMTYFGGYLAELYEAGNILDLGPYIDQYMPNYKAWLEANPQVIATTPVGDQNLHLTLTGIRANLSAYDLFAGWCYRRDWIVRYGVQPDMLFDPMADSEPRPNPKAGQAFSGHYTLDKDGTPSNPLRWRKTSTATAGWMTSSSPAETPTPSTSATGNGCLKSSNGH